MSPVRSQQRHGSSGFTLIEIMVVVVIIGVISAAMLLSVNLTGRDQDLEKETDRLLNLVNYAREQAEIQTRDYGVLFHDDGYQFLAYDVRRGLWREVYEDDVLRLRHLPTGLDVKLVVDARPVVLVSTNQDKSVNNKKNQQKQKVKSLADMKSTDDVPGLKGGISKGGRTVGDDIGKDTFEQATKIVPQVMIFSNGDLSSFEITVERENGVRSVTLVIDEKGQVIAKPMVETRT